MISRTLEAEILRLYHTEHWPIGTLATQLRVHHSTVRRVLAQAGVASARNTVRPSIVEPYLAFIAERLNEIPDSARESSLPVGSASEVIPAPPTTSGRSSHAFAPDPREKPIFDCVPSPVNKPKSTGPASVSSRWVAPCAH